jgi:hypothetical protein
MRKITEISGLVIVLGLMTASVSEAGTFSLVGVGDVNKPSVGGEASPDSTGTKVGLGGGALIDFGIAPWTSFEVGALYVNREAVDTTLSENVSKHAIQVPVLIRWWLEPMFSIAVGGYFAHGIGDVTTTNSISGGEVSSGSYADNNYKSNDYGLTGSVAIRLPITQSMRFLVDARYNYGLTNYYNDPLNSGVTIKNRDIQALVGFQFAMHSNR